ncbi:Dyp-type peroxidase [Streptomyces apocyni]|uniref:Dyp-type peroxidase n=1 Tax=Streptomyces apocyni TaxID=2654677 RepID=UPI0018D1DB3D|nr:Dyp-type peroxidase domain-containing protein [Streptomyces apocyni]
MTTQLAPIDFHKETGIGPEERGGEFSPEEDKFLRELQGNILKSHGRDHSRHLFIRFHQGKAEAGRNWLKAMSGKVTSAKTQWDQSATRASIFAAARQQPDPEAYLSLELAANPSPPFIGLMLSYQGYKILGYQMQSADVSFKAGTRDEDIRKKLGDPPAKAWEKGFQEDLHALVIIADDSPKVAEAMAKTIRESVETGLDPCGKVAHEEIGKVLRLRPDGPVREHFGFADGVSEPLFLTKDIKKAKEKEGTSRWDPAAPLKLILAKDPVAPKEGPFDLAGDGMTGFGTYVVYRKLEQDLARFNQQRLRLAEQIAKEEGRNKTHEGDLELAGAYMVGRFRNGMPVSEPANAHGVDDPIPNDFDYLHDKKGALCPFQSHTRKTNPRGDTGWRFGNPLEKERLRRITRRAISYEQKTGTGEKKVGLLFLCAQRNILDQFEFMQESWCNNVDFVVGEKAGEPKTGQDPVVGQGKSATEPRWPRKYGVPGATFSASIAESVTMRGGEYFFVPSMPFLENATTLPR